MELSLPRFIGNDLRTFVSHVFDPSAGFHRYGFLCTPKKVTWVIDGEPVHTETALSKQLQPGYGSEFGSIMMSAWTGANYWGGGPPEMDGTAADDYVYDRRTPIFDTSNEIRDASRVSG